MNLVDKQDRALSVHPQCILGILHDLFHIFFPRHRRVELLKTRARRVGNHARQRRFARSGRSVKNQRSELIRLDRPVQKLILSYNMLLSHHLVKRGRAQPGCQRCLLLDRIFPHIIK